MEKRVISLLLAFCLIAVGFTATAQSKPFVQVCSITKVDTGIEVVYRSGGTEDLTGLVYEQTADGKQGELLQVEQWNVPKDGVHTRLFVVPATQNGYVVRMGGLGIDIPKTIGCEHQYLANAWWLMEEETVASLKQTATHLTDITVSGTDVTDTDVTATDTALLQPGDQIFATWQGKPVTLWAVVPGDVDLDQKVDASDALMVLKHAVGKITLTDSQFAAANFFGTGKIDASNALEILKLAVGKTGAL